MLTIQQLSAEVGINVDTLRIWERRYNFPCPQRDRRGHRQYPTDQVEQLRIVRALQQAGQRPKNIFALSAAQRKELFECQHQHPPADVSQALHLAAHSSMEQLQRYLDECYAECVNATGGAIEKYIATVALPMIQALNDGGTDGSVTIAREHMVSDLLGAKLHDYLDASIAVNSQLRCLFVTLNGERHKLGLLMAACLFKQAGALCHWIQEDLPLTELSGVASELDCNFVVLSFSAHYSQRRALADLVTLRRLLTKEITVIAGGAALRDSVSMPQIFMHCRLDDISSTVSQLERRTAMDG